MSTRQDTITLTITVEDPIGIDVAGCVATMLEGQTIATDGDLETEITGITVTPTETQAATSAPRPQASVEPQHVVAAVYAVTGDDDEERFQDGVRQAPEGALFITSPLQAAAGDIANPDFDVDVRCHGRRLQGWAEERDAPSGV